MVWNLFDTPLGSRVIIDDLTWKGNRWEVRIERYIILSSGYYVLARVETPDCPDVVDPQTRRIFLSMCWYCCCCCGANWIQTHFFFKNSCNGRYQRTSELLDPFHPCAYTDYINNPFACGCAGTTAVQGSTGPRLYLEYLRMLTGGK